MFTPKTTWPLWWENVTLNIIVLRTTTRKSSWASNLYIKMHCVYRKMSKKTNRNFLRRLGGPFDAGTIYPKLLKCRVKSRFISRHRTVKTLRNALKPFLKKANKSQSTNQYCSSPHQASYRGAFQQCYYDKQRSDIFQQPRARYTKKWASSTPYTVKGTHRCTTFCCVLPKNATISC